ncbi:glycosyltransferase family 87 protein [Ralstonia soli]|uniref:DUF2029 domain-containing protein n=1 Tax=Ralstonia soli TaxID=2953896 RepID=A0ABT1AJH4_9RALS|nr:glycosyltransferase family 87 protein [Ralstonia soli]MCO5398528.1 DUF2029 domain-containing protein [Ralstonia soli]
MDAIEAAQKGSAHAPATPHWLNRERLRVYSATALACSALYFAIWSVRACVLKVPGVIPPGGDFVVFWSAAQMILQGHPLAAYDVAALHALELATVPGIAATQFILPWLYPPTFLPFVLPFGLLPYWLAVPIFLGISVASYLWVVKRIVPWRDAWLPCVAFPGLALVVVTGQNSLLLAACAGLALVLLPSRPIVAGVLLGLLTVKPQLALMFPVAFVCGRSWKALGAMAVTSLGLFTLAVVVFGSASLTAFLRNAEFARSAVEAGAVFLGRMPTVFALVRMLHGGVALAYAMHLTVALGATAVVAYAWLKPCSYALRTSAVLMATMLASAYLYDYDLVFMGLGMAWLATHGRRYGWLPGERELLILLWLLPLGGMLLIKWIHFQLMPIVLLLALVHIARRIYLERASNT